MLIVYATSIGLILGALRLFWSSRCPTRSEIDRDPSVPKALAVGALVLGIAFSTVILGFMVFVWIFMRIGPIWIEGNGAPSQ